MTLLLIPLVLLAFGLGYVVGILRQAYRYRALHQKISDVILETEQAIKDARCDDVPVRVIQWPGRMH